MKQFNQLSPIIKQNQLLLSIVRQMAYNSRRSSSVAGSNHGFQIRKKDRSRGLSTFQAPARKQSFSRSKHNHSVCLDDESKYSKVACKLTGINFNHHDKDLCVCEYCTCGRHLCKLHVIKPDMRKSTIYTMSYPEKKAITGPVIVAGEAGKLNGPHLDMNTIYLGAYNGKHGDQLQRPHPEDLLHGGGPFPLLTSYTSGFPGHKGGNQYVKPTDKHIRGYFPMKNGTTYAKEFVKKNMKKDDYTYFPDQLKTGSNWYGKTTYGSFYSDPNPQYFARPVKKVEKLDKNPDYDHQYETTYKNDFLGKQSGVCTAKVIIQTRNKGAFSNSKTNFQQNSDFKSMSPNFQAISTSKFI